MRLRFLATTILLATACLSCRGQAEKRQVRVLDNPASAPCAQPNLSRGADGGLYLSWIEKIEGGHALRFARWEGQEWSGPREISRGQGWFVNWADFPAMTALEDGTLATHWLAKVGGETYAYGIFLSLSKDGGATWSEPIVPHRDETSTEHGFVSYVPVGPGRVGLVWLDGRETGGHDHGSGAGAMTLRFATLDGQGQLDDEALLDSRVCDCCPTGMARTGDGSLLVVYRDRSEEEVRDISIVRRKKGLWTAPQAVHEDGWKIAGCPVNGPQIDAAGSQVVVAWFTVQGEDEGVVRAAFSEDGGRTFGDPIRVDRGNPLGRVDVVLEEDGTALVSWMEESGDGGADILLRAVHPGGKQGPVVLVSVTRSSRVAGFPRMARLGKEVFLTWTDPGEPSRVRTAVYR